MALEIAVVEAPKDRFVVKRRQRLLHRFWCEPRPVAIWIRAADGLHRKLKKIFFQQFLDFYLVGVNVEHQFFVIV